MRSRLLVLAASVLLALALAGPAAAAQPFRLNDQITDQVDAFRGREPEVRAALDTLRRGDNVQLWVVYVDSFEGINAKEWTAETARLSDLGLSDMLLAVATGDRAYAYSVDQEFPLSAGQLAEVATNTIEPALAEDDWAGAVVGATAAVSQTLGGGQATPSTTSPVEPGSSKGGWVLPWVLLIGVGAAAVAGLLWRRSRRGRAAQAPAGPVLEGAPVAETAHSALLTKELSQKAARLLVETDDAVKTSEQEVGFGEAQFGADLAAPFAAAVEASKADLAKAFQLQQQLTDAEPEDEATRQKTLLEMIRLADMASDRLDAESAKFDQFRDLERNAPQLLAALEQKIEALARRLPQSQAILTDMQGTYAPTAVAGVTDNPKQAEERLEFSRSHVAAAQADVTAGIAGMAVADLVAAEGATGQAAQLLDALDRLGSDLAQAADKIRAALEETERDLAEARALSAINLTLAAPTTEAAAAVALAREAASPEGGRDPLSALRRLEEADLALERALVNARDAEQKRKRAQASLEQALAAGRSDIAAAEDFIASRRGAIGGRARAELAEATRLYQKALAGQSTDFATALRDAEAADTLAQQALRSAQGDVSGYHVPAADPVPNAAGGDLGGFAGALLGGVLIEVLRGAGGMMGGGGRGRRGSSGGGRFGPASFGGRGTRGRRGGGGRF
ncbi:MAG: TPM domain-containing protein [Actinobacteria bacterium]|nr:TPM domain-containing protein [Actinomycetota bacterium]